MEKMSGSADVETLQFYNQEAATYCRRTGADPSPLLHRFLARLKPGACILELGCGSGRDSAEMLHLGYDVTPTDGCPEMARQAENRLARSVPVLEVGDLEGEARFDGVWAQACLLHVRLASLGDILGRVYRVLRSPGILFANFKEGVAEGRDCFGRYYNYPKIDSLKKVFEAAVDWTTLEIECSSGRGYDGARVPWLNCFDTK